MGKSTTAGLFSELGAHVYDADAAVHDIYGKDGAAVAPVGDAFPGVVTDGAIDRAKLSAMVLGEPSALKRLENIVHPLLGRHRQTAVDLARASGADVFILDVPLLFETGGDKGLDAVVVVSASEDLQRDRVLARPGMTIEKLDAILARQMPDREKRARADIVIDTSGAINDTRQQVADAMTRILSPNWTSQRPS